MSAFNLTENIKYDNKIVYDYDKIQIFKSAINGPTTNVPLNTEFVNARRGEPNISYTDENSISDNRYDSSKIYVYQLIHNNINSITTIDDTSIIGELVIEHTRNSDPTDKHYICFLLKHVLSGTDNEIDILLNFNNPDQDKSSAYIELNKVIPQQDNCIVYKSKSENNTENTVYVFTTPIEIHGTTSNDIIKNCPSGTNLFEDYKAAYIVLPANNITKRGEEEIYIDCNPTGESQETIDTYQIPINSQLSSNLEQSDNMKTVINFATFAVYSLVVAIVLPPLYKATAIKSALMSGVDPNGIRLRSIDSIICFSMIVTIIILISIGYNTIGLILLFTTVLGGLLIYTYKQNPDFIKISGKEIIYNPIKKFDINDILNSVEVLGKSMWNIIKDEKKEGWGRAFISIMVILFILLIMTAISGNIGWVIAVIIFCTGGPLGISLILALIRILSIPLKPLKPTEPNE